jgi:hypothetical protein
VRAFTLQTGLNFAGVYENGDNKGEIETFLSRDGHVTPFHFDFMDNFTLQLRGSKRWVGSALALVCLICATLRSEISRSIRNCIFIEQRFKQNDVSHPLRGGTPHFAAGGVAEQQLKAARLVGTARKKMLM